MWRLSWESRWMVGNKEERETWIFIVIIGWFILKWRKFHAKLRRMRENRLLLQYQYFLGDLFLMGFECLFFNKYSTSVEISLDYYTLDTTIVWVPYLLFLGNFLWGYFLQKWHFIKTDHETKEGCCHWSIKWKFIMLSKYNKIVPFIAKC